MDAMLVLKASLLLAAVFVAGRCLRRAPAARRHGLWTAAFAALLALPILSVVVPPLGIPVPPGFYSQIAPVARIASVDTPARSSDSRPIVAVASLAAGVISDGPEPSGIRRLSWSSALLVVWLCGAVAAAMGLMLSLIRVRRLARAATELTDPVWRTAADALAARLGLRRRARVVIARGIGTPMAGGVFRPIVFLPAAAHTWCAEHRDVVLAHELAHLSRHDPLRHVITRLAVAVYWFHPLAWLGARRALAAREQACDEAVLALGTRPSDYARVLLDLADSLSPSPRVLGALPIVDPSLLEKRLMAILTGGPPVFRRRRILAPAIVVVTLTLSLAAAQPTARRLGLTSDPAALPTTAAALAPAVPSASAAPTALQQSPSVVLPCSPAFARRLERTFGDRIDSVSVSGQASVDRGSGSVSLQGTTADRVFSFGMTTDRNSISEWVGSTVDGDRFILKRVGDFDLCLLAEGAEERGRGDKGPSAWVGTANRIVMEARDAGQALSLETDAGGRVISWRVAERDRRFDDAGRRWRERMLAAFDAVWELAALRGQESSVRGEISSVRGEESSLRGEISAVRGEQSSLRGEISAVRGEESALRGQISALRGEESSIRGEISAVMGELSALRAELIDRDRTQALAITAEIAAHESKVAQLQEGLRAFNAGAKNEIAAIEREIERLNAPERQRELERAIRRFDPTARVAEIEQQLRALDVDAEVAALERQLRELHVDPRSRQLTDEIARAIRQLEAAIRELR